MKLCPFLALAVTTFALAFTRGANADDAGDKVLVVMDAVTSKPKTQYFEYEAVAIEAGKVDVKASLNVSIVGEKFLAEFTAPDYLVGVKVLKVSAADDFQVNLKILDGIFDSLLPNSNRKKTTPIPSDKFEQVGYLIAMAQSLYPDKVSGQYAAIMSGNKVTLTPKVKPAAEPAGLEVSIFGAKLSVTAPKAATPKTPSKIEVTILITKLVPSEINVYDADGKLEITKTFSNYSNGSGENKDILAATTIKAVLHPKEQTVTLTRKTWKVNEPMADSTFSKENFSK